MILSILVKTHAEILIGITLNLCVYFGKNQLLHMLSFPTVHMISVCLDFLCFFSSVFYTFQHTSSVHVLLDLPPVFLGDYKWYYIFNFGMHTFIVNT